MIIDTQMGDNKAVECGCQAEGRASAGPGDWEAEEQVCFPVSDSALAFLGCLGQILQQLSFRMADCDVKQKEARAEYQGMR